MDITEKVDLNKQIKSYDGTNSFLVSLKKQLKTNAKLTKVDFNGKNVKILSDRQYTVAKNLLNV